MSAITTRPQSVYPLSAAPMEVATDAAPWVNGEWVPMFQTVGATVISGFVTASRVSFSFAEFYCEIEVGIGAAEEGPFTAIGAWPYYGHNAGIGGPGHGPQPITPVGTIPSGTWLAVRLRGNQSKTLLLSMRYHTAYDGDVASYQLVTLGGLPSAADAASITPSGTAFEPSAWFPIGDELEVDTDIVALLPNIADGGDHRWELGRRLAGAGEPTYVTTFPTANLGGLANFAELPNPYPFNAGDQAYLRLTTSSTLTDTVFAAFMVFRHSPEVVPGQGTIGPLLWISMPIRPPVV